MPLTLSLFASLLNLLSILTFMLPGKVIFKSILAPKLWLAYTNFFAITLLHGLILCLKNCSPIFLLDFFHTSSIISLMKILITNQFIQLIHLFLHFILMIRPIFLEYFLPTLLIFYATPRFLPQPAGMRQLKMASAPERPATKKTA